MTNELKPTEDISFCDVFGIETNMTIKGFGEAIDRVHEADINYKFSDFCGFQT